MGRNEIAMRLLSAESRVALHHMRSGTMTDEDWTRLARRMPDVSAAPLYIDDSPNLSMMEIRAKCRRLKQRNDLKLVVIDYLQLMQSGGSKRAESRQQEVSDMSRNLKLLAKELEIPVIALSQLNRGPEQRTDKKPMVSDLRESGSIEQDADMVILLHREDAYEKESPRAGEADLIVAKHRNGPTATITEAFQGHYSRFVDMAPTLWGRCDAPQPAAVLHEHLLNWSYDDTSGRTAAVHPEGVAAPDRRRTGRRAGTVGRRRRGAGRADGVDGRAGLVGGGGTGSRHAVPDRVDHQDLHRGLGAPAARRGRARTGGSPGEAPPGYRCGEGDRRRTARARRGAGRRDARPLVGADARSPAAGARRRAGGASGGASRRAAVPLLQPGLRAARCAGGTAAGRVVGGRAAAGSARTARPPANRRAASGPARGRLGGAPVGRRGAARTRRGPRTDGT